MRLPGSAVDRTAGSREQSRGADARVWMVRSDVDPSRVKKGRWPPDMVEDTRRAARSRGESDRTPGDRGWWWSGRGVRPRFACGFRYNRPRPRPGGIAIRIV